MKKLLLLTLIASSLFAFSTTNIQLLYGDFNDNSYVFDTKNGGKTTITLEHYSAFEYGDLYMFMDAYRADDMFKYQDSKSDFYAELAPRVDLGKIIGTDLSFLFVKKVYLAAQYNQGEEYKAYLCGFSADLEVPGFHLFGVSALKKNQNIGENNYQLTLWYLSKKIFDIFYVDAFIDTFILRLVLLKSNLL
jgi:nucleoside-specific outer membrane channel protein Tsx